MTQRTTAAAISLLVASLTAGLAFAQEKNPERNVYFGEQHVHTSWSVDAWLFGNEVTGTADALHYAQGQAQRPAFFLMRLFR